jgi:hypothetical protein
VTRVVQHLGLQSWIAKGNVETLKWLREGRFVTTFIRVALIQGLFDSRCIVSFIYYFLIFLMIIASEYFTSHYLTSWQRWGYIDRWHPGHHGLACNALWWLCQGQP